MKKLLFVAIAMALIAGPAYAWNTGGFSANYQTQEQNVSAAPFAGGFISQYTGTQWGAGGSLGGSEDQQQTQGINGSVVGYYAAHSYNFDTGTYGGSALIGGHVEYSDSTLTTATLMDHHGTASLAGTMMHVDQGAAAIGIAGSGTYVEGGSSYSSINIGHSSYIAQQGGQYVNGGTYSNGHLEVNQVGGTVATNSGNGQNMTGMGLAATHISTQGNAGATAFQTHSYQQAAGNGMLHQSASGTVSSFASTGMNP